MNGNPAYHPTDIKSYSPLKRLFQSREKEMETDQLDPEKDKTALLKNIKLARQDWLSALSNFDQAQDPELIDYYIYKMKACQVRYNYLLKKAKEIGLKQGIYCG